MNPFEYLARGWWCDPGMDYEKILEQRVHTEALYLFIDKDMYREDKSDANLWSVYAQEIRFRVHGLAFFNFKRLSDPQNQVLLQQIQILEKEKSRFQYLSEELADKLNSRRTSF